MKKNNYILIGIILLFLLVTIVQYGKPFHGDEIVFPVCAHAVLDHGTPTIDYGLYMPNFQCLWHAPLFIYVTALGELAFGYNVFAFRIVSTLLIIASALLVYNLTKYIFRKESYSETVGLIAVALYLFNPITVQSALVTDIDGGLLTFSLFLFVYLYLTRVKTLWLFASAFLVFASKESGPIILLPSLVVFSIYKRNIRELFRVLALIIGAGLAYYALFWFYTKQLGLNFSMPLGNFDVGGSSHFDLTSLFRMAWTVRIFSYFVIPFFLVLFLYSFGSLVYESLQKKESEIGEPLLFLGLVAILNIGLYVFLGAAGYNFPKYFATAMPMVSIVVAGVISPLVLKNWTYTSWFIAKNKWRIIILFIILIAYFISLVGDPLIPEIDTTAKNANPLAAITLISKGFLLYAIIPALLTFFILKGNRKVAATFILLTLFFYAYINVLHLSVPYSTSFRYGDQGSLEVISYFQEQNISSNHVAAYTNIGYYLGLSNFYEIVSLYKYPAVFKEKVIDNKEITYIVIYERDIDRIGEENMNYFVLEKKIGTYLIFKKK